MSNEKFKLHPVTAIINFVKALKDLLFQLSLLLSQTVLILILIITMKHFLVK